jgi:hypothetical protein
METTGIKNNLSFILTENAPILQLKGSKIEDSGKKLIKGTVVNGLLKTRVVNIDGEKIAYKFIELDNKKGYISPQVVNLYVGTFANYEGEGKNIDTTPVKETAFGEQDAKKKRTKKNYLINYGLPVLGGVVGYQIAKRTGADDKKMIGYVLFFGLLGWLPRYIYKTK